MSGDIINQDNSSIVFDREGDLRISPLGDPSAETIVDISELTESIGEAWIDGVLNRISEQDDPAAAAVRGFILTVTTAPETLTDALTQLLADIGQKGGD